MDDLRVLVADKDAPTRRRLADLVEGTEGVALLETCADGRTAIKQILRGEPDLVLLDAQMPGIDGIQVVHIVGPDRMPAVIFVTAYDQATLRAFELAPVDYLLKPFSDDRFRQAIARAREQTRRRSPEDLSEQMMDLLRSAEGADRSPRGAASPDAADADGKEGASGPDEAALIERIAVRHRKEIELVPVEDVVYFEAEGAYVNVHTVNRSHLIRERMKTLEKRLPPEQFCRVHRSAIVNLDRVAALEPTDPGDIMVRLTTGPRIRVSRSRRKELERRLRL